MLLKLLERLDRKRIVMDRVNDEPYLERYYLFLKDRKRFPFNVFLHKFLKSDPDDWFVVSHQNIYRVLGEAHIGVYPQDVVCAFF